MDGQFLRHSPSTLTLALFHFRFIVCSLLLLIPPPTHLPSLTTIPSPLTSLVVLTSFASTLIYNLNDMKS